MRFDKLEDAARYYGKALGYHGHVGGWIYTSTGGPTRQQGWYSFGQRCLVRGDLRRNADGIYVHLTTYQSQNPAPINCSDTDKHPRKEK